MTGRQDGKKQYDRSPVQQDGRVPVRPDPSTASRPTTGQYCWISKIPSFASGKSSQRQSGGSPGEYQGAPGQTYTMIKAQLTDYKQLVQILSHEQSLSLERNRFLHPEMDKYRPGVVTWAKRPEIT